MNSANTDSSAPRHIAVIRHAKAEPHNSTDHGRSLAARGRGDAPAAGRWLAEAGFVPDLVLCSTAVRTRQTWALVSGQLGQQSTPRTVFDDRLYGASPGELLEMIREAPDEVRALVVVGHNPGMHALAHVLAGGGAGTGADAGAGAGAGDGVGDLSADGGPAARMAQTEFPTSAVALLEVNGDWASVGREPGFTRLVGYWTPRG